MDEYRACHIQERRWAESLPYSRQLLSPEQTSTIARFVCDVFECEPPNLIKFGVPLPSTVTGQYHGHLKAIYIASSSWADADLVAHELAHHLHHELYRFSYWVSDHIPGGHHGKRFLDLERRIFKVMEEWMKGW